MNLTRVSRFLSLILRHHPEAIGITLDAHGWANVEDLLTNIQSKYPIDMSILEEIVNTDDKNRYSFNKEKTHIRANQGHSIDVDVELDRVEPPEYLWHGTGAKYSKSIYEKGIIPKSRLYVHLSQDADTATKVGSRHGTPVLLCIRSKDMYNDGYEFFKSKNGVYLTKYVPVQYFINIKNK